MTNIREIKYDFIKNTQHVRIFYYLWSGGFTSFFSSSGKLFTHDQIGYLSVKEVENHLRTIGFEIKEVIL